MMLAEMRERSLPCSTEQARHQTELCENGTRHPAFEPDATAPTCQIEKDANRRDGNLHRAAP